MPANEKKMRIDNIITGLEMGGAEMMLYKLLKALPSDRFSMRVISITENGSVGRLIEALGIPVLSLGMSPRFPNPLALLRLANWLRKDRPQIVQTWMYHADLIGGLAARMAGIEVLVWGIRNSTLDKKRTKLSTRLTVWLNAQLSRWLPDRIISCSESAVHLHANLGFSSTKMTMIPNGFDLDKFQPDDQARIWLRRELGLEPQALIIGHVARFNPQKDHLTLLDSMEKLLRDLPQVHLVLCGKGIHAQNVQLTAWIAERGLDAFVHLLGERDDVHRLMAAFDIATLTSAYGEAFPNVIGEAMACGVPCVVTDVGDARSIVGDTGKIVPPRDPDAVALAWKELLQMKPGERKKLGNNARERIKHNYSMQDISRKYIESYHELLDD